MSMQGDDTFTANGATTNRRMEEIANKATRQVQQLADSIGVNTTELQRRATETYGAVKQQVQDRPALAVGVAAASGLLLGMMLSRRQ